jgi:orotate phosphoribosyltransferase
MQSGRVLDLFRQCGALLEGHFQLSSGLHSPGYLQCALVLQHPEHAAGLGAAIAERVSSLQPRLVLSPALGGVVIGHEVARALGVRAQFAERREGVLTLRRGFRIEPDEPVLIVEDVITTGGSTRETAKVAALAGGRVVGAAAVINRGGPDVDVGAPLHALADVSWPTYLPEDCLLCGQHAELTKPGSNPGS